MFKIGVFGIITDERQRVLLCHRRDYDLWNLPGGGLIEGESPWNGMVREAKEETGLDVRVERLAGVYAKPDQNEIVFSFVCQVVGGRIAVNDEADRIAYFPLEEIPSHTSPNQVERIRHALQSGECALKMQSGPSSIELLRSGKSRTVPLSPR